MGDKTNIEWADSSWNPMTGCTKVSPGCDHCYAESIAGRFAGTKAYPDGFNVTLRPERLDQPLRWRKPRKVFVNSMSDPFHADIPDEYIARVFAVMALTPHHTFQILTKRHARMRALLNSDDFRWSVWHAILSATHEHRMPAPWGSLEAMRWPLPNVWCGVSVENQQWADIRIPALLDTPAAVRFLSCEPLLSHINLAEVFSSYRPGDEHPWNGSRLRVRDVLHWVIAGGESGPSARPMHPAWVRSLRDECEAAEVAFLFKQWGQWTPDAPARGPVKRVVWSDGRVFEQPWPLPPDDITPCVMWRTGKKAAGRVLDDRVWDDYPEIA